MELMVTFDPGAVMDWTAELLGRTQDMSPAMETVRTFLHAKVLKNLAEEDGGEYGGWPARLEESIKRRERLGWSATPVLNMSGDLVDSIEQVSGKLKAAAFIHGHSHGFYGRIHNSGFGRQEQRTFFHTSSADEIQIEEFLVDTWLNGFGTAELS